LQQNDERLQRRSVLTSIENKLTENVTELMLGRCFYILGKFKGGYCKF